MTQTEAATEYPTVLAIDGAWATNGITAGVYCGSCREWVDGESIDEPAGDIKVRHHYAVHANGATC
jgi:hypothetical protein